MQVTKKTSIAVSFDDIAALAAADRHAVDQLISDSLESDVVLVSQVSEYIVMSGGKRLTGIHRERYTTKNLCVANATFQIVNFEHFYS